MLGVPLINLPLHHSQGSGWLAVSCQAPPSPAAAAALTGICDAGPWVLGVPGCLAPGPVVCRVDVVSCRAGCCGSTWHTPPHDWFVVVRPVFLYCTVLFRCALSYTKHARNLHCITAAVRHWPSLLGPHPSPRAVDSSRVALCCDRLRTRLGRQVSLEWSRRVEPLPSSFDTSYILVRAHPVLYYQSCR